MGTVLADSFFQNESLRTVPTDSLQLVADDFIQAVIAEAYVSLSVDDDSVLCEGYFQHIFEGGECVAQMDYQLIADASRTDGHFVHIAIFSGQRGRK